MDPAESLEPVSPIARLSWWHGLAVIAASFGFQILVFFVAFRLGLSLKSQQFLIITILAAVASWPVAMLLVCRAVPPLLGQLSPTALFQRRVWQTVLLGVLGMVLVTIGTATIIALVGIKGTQQDVVAAFTHLAGGGGSLWPLVIFALSGAGFIPLLEELVFRGVVLNGLRNHLPFGWALVISSAVFGLAHLAGGSWVTAVQTGGLGLVLGWAYRRTGRLLAPALMHMTYNGLVLTLIFLFARSQSM